MRIKTISVVYERKWNMGSYESATVGATAWADLDEGEDEKAAFDALFAEVKGVVREQSLPLLAKRQGEVDEIIAGLPANVAGAFHNQKEG